MNDESLIVPLGPARAEITVVNSRFIASLDYVGSVEEAAIRRKESERLPVASHTGSPLYRGGATSSTNSAPDDGEPGHLLAAVLSCCSLRPGNVAEVVAESIWRGHAWKRRLVKAYSEAGKAGPWKEKRAALEKFATLRRYCQCSLLDRLLE